MLSGKNQGRSISPNSFTPVLNGLLSVPVALLFGLAVQGFSSPYTISLISLGLLASLDLRRGSAKAVLGFAVTTVASLLVLGNSLIGKGLAQPSLGQWSLLLVSLPLALGVLFAGMTFSRNRKYNIIQANLLASLTLTVGLAMAAGSNPSLEPIISSPLLFIALALPANICQMVLLHFLNQSWKTRSLSLAMMPTAFFGFNMLNFLGYLVSHDLNQLYSYFWSLGFLPVLTLTGISSSTLANKLTGAGSSTPSSKLTGMASTTLASKLKGTLGTTRPTVTITADSFVQQGRDQTIKIATKSGGQSKIAKVEGTITKPGGRAETLKLSQVSAGEYKASYRPGAPGDYTVHVTATSKEHSTGDKSFAFTVEAPPAHYSTPRYPPSTISPPPSTRIPQSPISQSQPPPQQFTTPPVKGSVPKLDNWNPSVWVNQEVHGYRIKELLATGLTGYVFRGGFEPGGVEMAIKIPILKSGIGVTALNETMSEATRLLELSEQSKNVVQLRGILLDRLNVQEILKGDVALYLKSPPAIVMELMKGGAVKKLVEDPLYDSLYYSEKWGSIVMLIGSMIATALETIHKAGFAHLDVKPQNILFNVKPPATGGEVLGQIRSGTLVPKLADLGSAVRIGGKVTQFTPEYAPGEQVLGNNAAATMDIYALGATIYNMLTRTPVNSKKLIDTMNNVPRDSGSGRVVGDLKSVWNSFQPDFGKISKFSSAVPVLKKMLAKEPPERPGAGSAASSLRGLGNA